MTLFEIVLIAALVIAFVLFLVFYKLAKHTGWGDEGPYDW